MIDAQDHRFMSLALALGRRGQGNAWPNPAVGAVLVKDGVIVGRGWTQPGGRPHAETQALARAGEAARGATLYVTLEPCSHFGVTPPCADAIIAAGVARVVSAIEDPHSRVAGEGHARLRAAGIAVEVGLCGAQALHDHAGHIMRMREGRPMVTLKLAVSADGKAGLAGRKPVAITGEAARTRVHLMRARHDAILVGIGTALADNPALTVRLPGMDARSPVRVVLDPALALPPQSALTRSARETPVWAVCGADASSDAEAALRALGVEMWRMTTPGRIDLRAMLTLLGTRGVTRLMVEGGPTVAAAFVKASLVDAAVLFFSGTSLPGGIDALEGLPLAALTVSASMRLVETQMVGHDRMECYERA